MIKKCKMWWQKLFCPQAGFWWKLSPKKILFFFSWRQPPPKLLLFFLQTFPFLMKFYIQVIVNEKTRMLSIIYLVSGFQSDTKSIYLIFADRPCRLRSVLNILCCWCCIQRKDKKEFHNVLNNLRLYLPCEICERRREWCNYPEWCGSKGSILHVYRGEWMHADTLT